MDIGFEIAKKRKEKKLTQRELADMLNVTDKTISRWEKGNSIPDIYSLKKLAYILDIDLNNFFDSVPIEINENESINYEWIYKFRKSYILSLLLILFSTIMVVFIRVIPFDGTNTNNIVNTIFFITSIITSMVSIAIFIIGLITYRSGYAMKKNTKKYNRETLFSCIFFSIFVLLYVLAIIIK